jgi:hypothetical protein
MSGYRIVETIQRSDIQAIFEVGAEIALVGDASHTHGAPDFKPFHIELNLDITEEQIAMLRSRFNGTYIKLKSGLMFGGGRVDLEIYHYEQDLLELLHPNSQYDLRTNRAAFNHGAKRGMIPLNFR